MPDDTLECGHPPQCCGLDGCAEDECAWCREADHHRRYLSVLLEQFGKTAIRLGPGKHDFTCHEPIGLLVCEKGSVIHFGNGALRTITTTPWT